MQEKLIEILSAAKDRLTASEIADLGGWRSNAHVGIGLAHVEKTTGQVVRRNSPTKRKQNGMPATEWALTDKPFAQQTSSETTQAGSGDITPAAAHSATRVAGSIKDRADPPLKGAANVIEAAKRDDSPAAPASDELKFCIGMIRKALGIENDPEIGIVPTIEALFAADEAYDKEIKRLNQLLQQSPRGKTIHIEPCPFCGFDDVEIGEVRVGEFSVDCPECEAIGPIKPSEMEAISFWNDRRAA